MLGNRESENSPSKKIQQPGLVTRRTLLFGGAVTAVVAANDALFYYAFGFRTPEKQNQIVLPQETIEKNFEKAGMSDWKPLFYAIRDHVKSVGLIPQYDPYQDVG